MPNVEPPQVVDTVDSFCKMAKNKEYVDNDDPEAPPNAPGKLEVRKMDCTYPVLAMVKRFLYLGSLDQTNVILVLSDVIECLEFANMSLSSSSPPPRFCTYSLTFPFLLRAR